MSTATGDTSKGLTTKIMVGVMLGVLLAVAVVFLIYTNSGPSPEECQVQRLEEASGARSSASVDDACR